MSSQVVEEQSRALQLDALRSSHPVEVPIRHAKADALVGWVPMGDIWIKMAIESHGNNIELIYIHIYIEMYTCILHIHIYIQLHIYIDTYGC